MPVQSSKACRDGCSRIFIFERQLHERREAEPQPVLVSLRERSSQDTVEQEARFEVGSGGSVLDHPYPIAQVELFRALLDGPEQPLQAPSQIRSLGDVGLGLRIRSPHKKHRRGCRYGGEYFRIPFRCEFQALSQHKVIVSKSSPRRHGNTRKQIAIRSSPCLGGSVVSVFI